jgi:hypothetical protein
MNYYVKEKDGDYVFVRKFLITEKKEEEEKKEKYIFSSFSQLLGAFFAFF